MSANSDNVLISAIIEPLKLSALDFVKLLGSMCYEHTLPLIFTAKEVIRAYFNNL